MEGCYAGGSTRLMVQVAGSKHNGASGPQQPVVQRALTMEAAIMGAEIVAIGHQCDTGDGGFGKGGIECCRHLSAVGKTLLVMSAEGNKQQVGGGCNPDCRSRSGTTPVSSGNASHRSPMLLQHGLVENIARWVPQAPEV